MKRRLKYIFLIVCSLIVLFTGLFLVSYIRPGRIPYADELRVKIQTTVLKFLGDTYITDFSRYEYGEEEKLHLINFEELSLYVSKLETGDFFFTESENYLSSQLTPGRWKHSVIYLGREKDVEKLFTSESETLLQIKEYYEDEEDILILDGSEEGVAIRKLQALSNVDEYSFLKSIIGIEVKLSAKEKRDYIEYALDQLGKPYDYDMDTEDKSEMYCSELLYHALSDVGIIIENNTQMLARTAVSPTDLVEYFTVDDKFNVIFLISKKEGKLIEE